MHRRTILAASLLPFVLPSRHVAAETFGTRPEAEALVKKAIAYVAEVGPEKAFAAFSEPKGAWVDRDLYIFVIDHTGIRLAHGQNPRLVGKSMFEIADVNGKAYGRDIWDTASKAPGWVDYWFTDPVTKKILPKSVYVEKTGDYVFGCGVYTR